MRIAVVHGNDGSDVRIGKMCRSLSKMGHDVHFIGWDRRPDTEKEIDLGRATPHIIVRKTRLGRASLTGQFHFFLHIARVLAKLRPQTVQCVNEDFALLVLPFRGLFYQRLVCDVFDSLVDRHSHRSPPILWGLRIISELVRNGADRLIATDAARFKRFGRYRRKCVIVENAPEDPGDELSRGCPSGAIKVYVAGSLSQNRGLRQIIEVAERVGDLEIVSAGWLYDDYASRVFAVHPKVSFKGIVTARESLRLAAGCDAVLAFYSPTSVNNLYASPNKIYDAMSVGRPVIINSEVRVAQWILSNNVGWACGYDDTEGLEEIVLGLAPARASLPASAARLRELYVRGCTWERMEKRLMMLYESLARVALGGESPACPLLQ